MNRRLRKQAVSELADFARDLAGDTAVIEMSSHREFDIDVFQITPVRADSRAVTVIGEQWLIVQAGEIGGRFELDWSEASIELAKEILAGVIDGRVEERFGKGRSVVKVTAPDGTVHVEVGYEGCLTALIPQFGWRTWGRLRRYAPYAPAEDL